MKRIYARTVPALALAVGIWMSAAHQAPAWANGPAAGAAGALAGPPYTVNVAKAQAKLGAKTVVQVKFKPGAGYHLNQDFPTTLKLTPTPGVAVEKPNQAKADAQLTEQEGRFDVALTVSEAGAKTIVGELRFAVCTNTTCEPQRTQVKLEVVASN